MPTSDRKKTRLICIGSGHPVSCLRAELTDAGSCQDTDTVIRWLALREEELDSVLGKGERHNGHGAGPHNEALCPEPHEAHEGAQRVQDVGVIPARLLSTTQ
jgi:hypothetical protein